ncbi:hypothetical protein YC2023_101771 [Brassica napus]
MSSAAESTKKPYDSLIDSVFSVSSSSKLPTAFLLSFRICSSLQSSLRSENHKLSHSQDGGEEAGPTRNKRERTAIPHRRSIDTISLPDNQTSSTKSENHKLSHSQDGGEEAGPTRNKRERIAIPHHRSIDTISLPDNQTSPTNPALQKLQHQDLKCTDESSSEKKAISSLAGTPVHWHATLEEAPSGGMHVCYIYLLRLSYEALGLISNSQRLPTIIIAHEFYDALPVHQNLHEAGVRKWLMWKKIHTTPEEKEKLEHVEISPKSMDLTQEIAKRIGSDGGGALIIDYGKDGIILDSLQAIREHKFVNILDNPGSADLSAYVDFPSIKHSAEEASENVTVRGHMTQSRFLGSLGINFRVDALLQNCDDEQAESLRSGYWRLVGDGEAPLWEGPDEQTPIGMGGKVSYNGYCQQKPRHSGSVPVTN